MAIEKQYRELYNLVGIPLTPEDTTVADDRDRIVFVSIDANMVYLNAGENPSAFPLKIDGNQWSLLWWMYRLSERKCRFQDYLSEHLVPACRKHFVAERKRLEERFRNNSEENE